MKYMTLATIAVALMSSAVHASYTPARNVDGGARTLIYPALLMELICANAKIVFKRSCTQEVPCISPDRTYSVTTH